MKRKSLTALTVIAMIIGILSAATAFAEETTTAVKVETKATVLTAKSGNAFTFEEKSLSNVNVTITADEDMTIGEKEYKKGDTVDTGKSGGTFNLPDGKYKATANGSKFIKTTDAASFEVEGEDKTVAVKGTVPQKYDVKVKNAKDGFTYEIAAAQDIKDYKGAVICSKDTVLGTASGSSAEFKDLPIETVYGGKYKVSEKAVPDGYFKADPVEVKGDASEADDVKEVSFADKTTKTTFKLVGEDGKEISSSKFKLAIIPDGSSEEQELDGMTVSTLKAGAKFTVKSTETAPGYLPFEQEFTVGEDAKEKVITIEVAPTKISLIAVDTDEEKSPVAGCSLVLYQGETKLQSFTSTKAEKIISKLPAGEYKLEMTHAPKGYCVGEPVTFTVEETDEIQPVEISVVRPKGYIALTLVSVVNRTPLEGAEFEFRDAEGNVISKLTTNSKGEAKTDLVEIGIYKDGVYTDRATYKLQETKATKGYVCDKTEYKLLFDYVDDTTPEVHIEATLPNRSETDEPVKTKLVAKQVATKGTAAANQKGSNVKTGDRRLLLVGAALLVIIALIVLTFVPGNKKKKPAPPDNTTPES